MKKWILIIGVMAAFNANAATSGNCGPKDENGKYTSSCIWTYENNTLTISGNGQMADFSHTGQDPNRTTMAPWKDKLSEINNIVIQEGISNIGGHAFTGGKNLDHLELPESVKEIRIAAFEDASLRSVNTLKYVDTLGSAAFYTCSLSTVELSDNLKRIESYTFAYNHVSELIIPDSVEYIGDYALFALPANAKVFCNDENERCKDLLFGQTYTGLDRSKLVKYTIEDNLYVTGGDPNPQYFASSSLMAKGVSCESKKQCEELLASAQNGIFSFNGKFYYSLDDLAHHKNIKKRIYTIDEANTVTGPINRVSIKYR